MRPDERDAALLWDMLQAAKTIREFAAGASLERYLANRMLQSAVERHVEIIGEAARKVSPGFKAAHPDIPWQGIISQRNVLVHEYGRIIQDRMWAIATKHAPDLIGKLEPLIPPLPPG